MVSRAEMEATGRKRKRKSVLTLEEKNRRIAERSKRISATRVVIGNQIDRLRSLRVELGLKTDEATARFLLDGLVKMKVKFIWSGYIH